MPDAYSQITAAEPAVLEKLINAMEVRAADPAQLAIRERFFAEVGFPEGARLLEAGCGSGAVCRQLAGWAGVAEVVGLDPSPAFLTKARELAAGWKGSGSTRATLVPCPMTTASSMWSSSTPA